MCLEIIRSTSDGGRCCSQRLGELLFKLGPAIAHSPTRVAALFQLNEKHGSPDRSTWLSPAEEPADVDRIAQHAGVSVCGLVHITRRNDRTCADLHRLLFDGVNRHEVKDRTLPHRPRKKRRCASQQIWRPMSQMGLGGVKTRAAAARVEYLGGIASR